MMEKRDLPHWDLSQIYPSVEKGEFKADLARVRDIRDIIISNMEVLGMVLSSTDGKTGVILHSTADDDSYWYYEMGRVGENGPETFEVERTELIYLSMTTTSVFATSADFPDFLFYTDGGGNLYSYNLITGVETLMYSVNGTITDIAFAISTESGDHLERRLRRTVFCAIS